METTPAIEVSKVSFFSENQQIISDISLVFPRGTSTAIIGPSGSGKSTLLKLAAGLIIPTAGKIFYNGRNIAHLDRAGELDFRRHASFVFQDAALWANQSLYASLELPLKIHFPGMNEEERRSRIKSAVSDAGYKRSLDVRPSALSAGEQKLIAFARAMILEPQLIFLDEWTESLDETASRRLQRLVKARHTAGASVIFVSHNRSVIERNADRFCIISEGTCHGVFDITELADRFENDSLLKEGIEE